MAMVSREKRGIRRPRTQWAWDNAAEVYEERDLLVCFAARMAQLLSDVASARVSAEYGAHVMKTDKGRIAICIHTPEGQLAWTWPLKAKDADATLQANGGTFYECLKDLPTTKGDWDGAKTEERKRRLKKLASTPK